jgi:heat shock protein HslJ
MGTEVSPVIFEDESEPLGPPPRQRPLWPWLAAAAAALAVLAVVVHPSASFHRNAVPKPRPVPIALQAPYGDWVLTSFGTRDNGAQVTDQPAVGQRTLKLGAGAATSGVGSSILADIGCGTTSGQVDLARNADGTSGTLSLGQMATTASGCGDQSITEADMATSLNYVFAGGSNGYPHRATWSFDGTNLVIGAAPVLLNYVRAETAITTPALLGTSWQLSGYTDANGVSNDSVVGAWLRITLDGVVHGNDGCNTFDTTADVSGTAQNAQGDAAGLVVFHSGSFTAVGCASARTYNSVLFEAGATASNGPASWQIFGTSKMTLSREGAGTLVFIQDPILVAPDSATPTPTTSAAALPPAALKLLGTTWELVAIHAGEASTNVLPSSANPPWLSIQNDGKISGTDGCHAYVANYIFVVGAHSADALLVSNYQGLGGVDCPGAQTYPTIANGTWNLSEVGNVLTLRQGGNSLQFRNPVGGTSAP